MGHSRTGVVCRPSEARVTKTPVQWWPFSVTCIELYFFLTKCAKLILLFVLRAQSSSFTHVVRKINWSAHARLLRTPCVKKPLCACTTSMKSRVLHITLKKKKKFSHSVRKAGFCTRSNKKACPKLSFEHVVSKNCVRYSNEKVILSSCGLFTLVSLGCNILTRIKSLFRTCIENNYFFMGFFFRSLQIHERITFIISF